MGTNPKSLVAFVGPHSPLAQSGNGTITVCKSSQHILNLQTLLNFIGSPVRYSFGVTAFAKMSNKRHHCTVRALETQPYYQPQTGKKINRKLKFH